MNEKAAVKHTPGPYRIIAHSGTDGVSVEAGKGHMIANFAGAGEANRANALLFIAALENCVVDELTYRSYAFNRQNFPEVLPERWATIFPNASEMEERFQQHTGSAILDLEKLVDRHFCEHCERAKELCDCEIAEDSWGDSDTMAERIAGLR